MEERFVRDAGVDLATIETNMKDALTAVDGDTFVHGQMKLEWTVGTDFKSNYGKSNIENK